MRILVFVKDVPAGPDLPRYTDRRTLDRTGESTMSGVDAFAVAEAVRLSDDVTVATVGPDGAAGTLRDALSLGARRALHVCDDSLAGSDALVTSLVLERLTRIVDPDLVLLGRESGDGRLGVMAGMLAERLGWPTMSAVDRITTVGTDGGQLATARQRAQHGTATLASTLPLVASAAEYAAEPRPITALDLRRAFTTPIERHTARSLNLEHLLPVEADVEVVSVEEVRPPRLGRVVTEEPAAAVLQALASTAVERVAS